MTFIDVSVPLDLALPDYPGNTPFSLDAIERIARGDNSNLSTLHSLCDVEPGEYDRSCLPLRLVGSDGAPARVVLRRS
jgi:kynurenine formamidase